MAPDCMETGSAGLPTNTTHDNVANVSSCLLPVPTLCTPITHEVMDLDVPHSFEMSARCNSVSAGSPLLPSLFPFPFSFPPPPPPPPLLLHALPPLGIPMPPNPYSLTLFPSPSFPFPGHPNPQNASSEVGAAIQSSCGSVESTPTVAQNDALPPVGETIFVHTITTSGDNSGENHKRAREDTDTESAQTDDASKRAHTESSPPSVQDTAPTAAFTVDETPFPLKGPPAPPVVLPTPRQYVLALITNNIQVKALYDDGAEVSLISHGLWQQMQKELPNDITLFPPPGWAAVSGVVPGHGLDVMGTSIVPFSLGKIRMEWHFVVVRELHGQEMILGRDWDNAWVLEKSNTRNTLQLRTKHTIHLLSDCVSHVDAHCRMKEFCTIPAHSVKRVWLQARTHMPACSALFIPSDGIMASILGADLVEVMPNHQVGVFAYNYTDQDISLAPVNVGQVVSLTPNTAIIGYQFTATDFLDYRASVLATRNSAAWPQASSGMWSSQPHIAASRGPGRGDANKDPLDTSEAVGYAQRALLANALLGMQPQCEPAQMEVGSSCGLVPLFEPPGSRTVSSAATTMPQADLSPQPRQAHEPANHHVPPHEREQAGDHNNGQAPISTGARIPWKYQFCDEHSEAERAQIAALLDKHYDLFIKDEYDYGRARNFEATFEVTTKDPIFIRQWPLEHKKLLAAVDIITQMFDRNEIEDADCPHNTPCFLVPKPSGGWRFIQDLRAINAHLRRDVFPLPNMNTELDRVAGAKVFAKTDLSKSFWQIPLAPSCRPYTAFTLNNCHYQATVLPMGLSNSPSIMARFMHRILKPVAHLAICYVDDIITWGRDLAEVISKFDQIFTILAEHGLKLDAGKTEIGVKETKALGHILTPEGIKPDPKKIQTIIDWPVPRTVKQVQSFLGLCNYLRRWIQNFARRAAPLQAYSKLPTTRRFTLSETAIAAFDDLKGALISAPVMCLPDMSPTGGKFVLRTDACKIAGGAILYQEQPDGQLRVVAYASHKFSPIETRYGTSEREMLALVQAITQDFRIYLWGNDFEAYTDHKPNLTIRGTSKIASDRIYRWAAKLQTYTFKLFYKKGVELTDADSLSRIAYSDYEEYDKTEMEKEIAEIENEPPKVGNVTINNYANLFPSPLTHPTGQAAQHPWACAVTVHPSRMRASQQRGFPTQHSSHEGMPQTVEVAITEAFYAIPYRGSVIHVPLHRTPPSELQEMHECLQRHQAKAGAERGNSSCAQPAEPHCHIGAVTGSGYQRDAVIAAQAQDPMCADIMYILTSPDPRTNNKTQWAHSGDRRARESRPAGPEEPPSPPPTPASNYVKDPRMSNARRRKLERITRHCFLDNGVLYYFSTECRKLFVPQMLQHELLESLHDSNGHIGVHRTLQALRSYYWPKMVTSVRNWVKSCTQCQARNVDPHLTQREAHITRPRPIKPFERLSVDTLGPFKTTAAGNTKIVVFMCEQTRWAEAFCVQEDTAETIAHLLRDEIVFHWGAPRSLLSDRGEQYLSSIVVALCKLLNITKVATAAYTPTTNGRNERSHRPLNDGLAKMCNFESNDWDEFVPAVMHGYRTTTHAATGYSPFYLVTGMHSTTLPDVALLPEGDSTITSKDWLALRRQTIRQLQHAREFALINQQQQPPAPAQQRANPQMAKLRRFFKGQAVVIRNHGHPKLGPRWLHGFEITKQLSPYTYEVRNTQNVTDKRVYSLDDIDIQVEKTVRGPTPVTSGLPVTGQDHGWNQIHDDEREVDSILDMKIVTPRATRNRKTVPEQHYLIRWKDYPRLADTWLPQSQLRCVELLQQFHNKCVTTGGDQFANMKDLAIAARDAEDSIPIRDQLPPPATPAELQAALATLPTINMVAFDWVYLDHQQRTAPTSAKVDNVSYQFHPSVALLVAGHKPD